MKLSLILSFILVAWSGTNVSATYVRKLKESLPQQLENVKKELSTLQADGEKHITKLQVANDEERSLRRQAASLEKQLLHLSGEEAQESQKQLNSITRQIDQSQKEIQLLKEQKMKKQIRLHEVATRHDHIQQHIALKQLTQDSSKKQEAVQMIKESEELSTRRRVAAAEYWRLKQQRIKVFKVKKSLEDEVYGLKQRLRQLRALQAKRGLTGEEKAELGRIKADYTKLNDHLTKVRSNYAKLSKQSEALGDVVQDEMVKVHNFETRIQSLQKSFVPGQKMTFATRVEAFAKRTDPALQKVARVVVA